MCSDSVQYLLFPASCIVVRHFSVGAVYLFCDSLFFGEENGGLSDGDGIAKGCLSTVCDADDRECLSTMEVSNGGSVVGSGMRVDENIFARNA